MTALMERTNVAKDAVQNLLGLEQVKNFHFNLPPAALIEQAVLNGEGNLADTGALMVDTDKFTGRSPNDRYIVSDDKTIQSVWWRDINFPFDSQKIVAWHIKLSRYLKDNTVYLRQ